MMAGPEAPRRPKLSLQIKPAVTSQARTRKSALAHANPRSPTTFNTLSNVYVTAIERSTPVQSTPITAINTQQQQPLRLQTDLSAFKDHQHRAQSPFAASYPDTPLSANPISPAQSMDIVFPSQQMTATPPLSAGPTEPAGPKPFSFANADATTNTISVPQSPAQARRRAIYGAFGSMAKAAAPYSHNRALHSILRNSPLPPSSATAVSPLSPRRQSRRLQEKAARRVGYESPLTQTIITEKYTHSHIELLAATDDDETSSPYTPSPVAAGVEDSEMMLDFVMMSYPGDGTENTRDGGQTPGPFEEMRRRMTTLGTGVIGSDQKREAALSPRSDGGVRKNRHQRRRKEKKRKWVWTIGNQGDDIDNSKDDEEEGEEGEESGSIRAIREATASTSTSIPIAAEQGNARAVPLLPPPLPPSRRRSVGDGGNSQDGNSNRNSNSRKAETPEPVTAILRTSVEQHRHLLEPPSKSSDATAADHHHDQDMDVDMSDDAAGSNDGDEDGDRIGNGKDSSRTAATTPYSMDVDPNPDIHMMKTPIATERAAAATPTKPPVLVVKTEDRLGLGSLASDQDTGSRRRDTPIPPDLVTGE
ncbi:hypothetical protein SLS62_002260 [Diatrype stigma]|uniref:Uncharacterized protein n=1 Tax=Diatrype stigma TaxID=117547 RepID=A0AAN9V0E7_9PEZI